MAIGETRGEGLPLPRKILSFIDLNISSLWVILKR